MASCRLVMGTNVHRTSSIDNPASDACSLVWIARSRLPIRTSQRGHGPRAPPASNFTRRDRVDDVEAGDEALKDEGQHQRRDD